MSTSQRELPRSADFFRGGRRISETNGMSVGNVFDECVNLAVNRLCGFRERVILIELRFKQAAPILG